MGLGEVTMSIKFLALGIESTLITNINNRHARKGVYIGAPEDQSSQFLEEIFGFEQHSLRVIETQTKLRKKKNTPWDRVK